jgi:segregation and condensation protein B
MNQLAALEAVLFVAEGPIPSGELAEVLEIPKTQIEELIGELNAEMEGRGAGVVLRQVAGGWRMFSHPDAFPYLERFSSSATSRRMSSAALETLAVIAYRQPVSRTQVSEIRGVDSDSAMRTLERMGLIEERGRLNLPGNPAIYVTTSFFLERLGLDTLDGLPPLADHVPPATFVASLEESLRPGQG